MTYAQLAALGLSYSYPLGNLGVGTPQTDLLGTVTADFGPIGTYSFSPSSGPVPNCVAVRLVSGRVLVWARGVESLLQAAYYMASATPIPLIVGGGFGIDAVDNYASTLRQLLSGIDYSAGDDVTLAGHSFGGAAVIVLAQMLLVGGHKGPLSTHTYGSPKPGIPALLSRANESLVYRWMTANDIVPALPPSLLSFPFAVATVSPALGAAWGLQGQIGTGLYLPGDGTIQLADGGSTLQAQTLSNLAVAILSGDTDANSPHFIRSYSTALSDAAKSMQVNATPATTPTLPPQAPSQGPPVGNGARLPIGINTVQRSTFMGGPIIPQVWRASLYGTATPAFTVTAGPSKNVLAGFDSGGDARRLMKYWNKVLQGLTRAPLVSPTGVQAAIAAMLAQLLQPGQGFSPTPQTWGTTQLPS